jgi:hypothetical protein
MARCFTTKLGLLFLMLSGLDLASPRAQAGLLTLTPAGVAMGFTLEPFASGFPNTGLPSGLGPFGVAYRADGRVLVGNQNGDIYLFPSHADNQVAVPGMVVASYGSAAAIRSMAQDYSYAHTYMAMANPNRVVEIDANGQLVRDVIAPGSIIDPLQLSIFPGAPIAPPSPLTGHLFVSSGLSGTNQIFDVNPLTGTVTPFTPNMGTSFDLDGMSFSPDGSVLYAVSGGMNIIRAFSTSNPASYVDIPGGPGATGLDGVSIGLGTLTGYIYANYNDGTVWQLGLPGGPHAGAPPVKIADGGSRGDFVYMDPAVYSGGAFPSLLLTQTDSIYRLDPPGGGFFVSNLGPDPVPEPASLMLLATGLASLLGVRWWRKKIAKNTE